MGLVDAFDGFAAALNDARKEDQRFWLRLATHLPFSLLVPVLVPLEYTKARLRCGWWLDADEYRRRLTRERSKDSM